MSKTRTFATALALSLIAGLSPLGSAGAQNQPATQTASFAGGCFWAEEKAFDGRPGV